MHSGIVRASLLCCTIWSFQGPVALRCPGERTSCPRSAMGEFAMSEPLIVTAALNGAEVTREQCPYLPILPEEIAEEARRAREAGATVVHVHGRHPDGTPTQDREVYRRILEAIRSRTDILVQFSTGGAVGMAAEERIQALDLMPDIATLTLGSVNFGSEVFMNALPMVRDFLERFNRLGVPAELEIFDSGMLGTARYLIDKSLIRVPYYFDFVLGVPGGMTASLKNLLFLSESLPAARPWSVAGIGRHQLPMAVGAILQGGHVRVGFEDNIYLRKGEPATSNAQLVERVVKLASEMGRPPATIEQTRSVLGLREAL